VRAAGVHQGTERGRHQVGWLTRLSAQSRSSYTEKVEPTVSPMINDEGPVPETQRLRRRHRAAALLLAAALSVAACASPTVRDDQPPGDSAHPGSSAPAKTSPPTKPGVPTKPALPPASAATITVALAGDSNVEGAAGRVLEQDLGPVGQVLARANVAIVNSETILADDRSGLQPQPKAYTFLAPTRFLDVLGNAGIDAVTVANNHGMDFGRKGLERTLAARTKSRPYMVGAGETMNEAFAPWRATVKGRNILLFGATDVMDGGLDWPATPDRSGIASIKSDEGFALLRKEVRDARRAGPSDVIIVYLHAGVERVVCPTGRQEEVAKDLAADGATVVAMSHAHVLQPYTTIGDTAVAYGLGNFIFGAHSPVSSRTGVLVLTIAASGPPRAEWHPATIQRGLPVLDNGTAAERSLASWQNLEKGC
jgi:poly-gamma-glutamate capsule biosynthesis protein CapA/YwtB (metallophosphatase superfamily)